MSFTLTQRREGRRPSGGDNPSNEVPYRIQAGIGDPTDEESARDALEAGADATLGGLVIRNARIDERLGEGLFNGTVIYGSPDYPGNKEVGDSTYSFDTTGGTFKRTQAISQSHYPSGAPDLAGVIGASTDGEPEGVDITVRQFSFSITCYFADEDVDETFANLIFSLTGKTNIGTFRGLDAGACLFQGARGSKRGKGDWEITFEFAASPNVTGLTIGTITGIAKKGWQYLWVRYETAEIGAGADKILAPKPKAVYVADVYEEGDFSLLGIP